MTLIENYDRLTSGQPVRRVVLKNGSELRYADDMTVAWVDEDVEPNIWLSVDADGVWLSSNAERIVNGHRDGGVQGFKDALTTVDSVS